MNKIGYWFIAVLILILIILGIILFINFTFNYTILTVFIVLIAIITVIIYYNNNENKNGKSLAIDRIWQIVIAFEVLSITVTLHNYFFANESIYTNSDHHAVRVDGISINSPVGYLLSGKSSDAFFDNDAYSGSLSIKNYDSLNVILSARNFSQAVYFDNYNSEWQCTSKKILNTEDLIRVQPSDTIRFVGERNTCDLYLDYNVVHESFIRKLISKIIGKKRKKSICHYVARYNDRVDTLSYDAIIRKGYSLNGILGEVNCDLNFNGINLLRDTHYLNFPKKQLGNEQNYYSNQPLYLEINGAVTTVVDGHRIKKILVIGKDGRKEYSLNAQHSGEYTIPIGQAFSIGLISGERTPSVRFKYDGRELSLQYITPLYHNLTSLNKIGANNIYLTTSTRQITENNNIPENIMLFDIFYNEDNVNNLKTPILLSYVSGPTTQDLEFNVGETKIAEGQNFKNLDLTQSQSQKISWNITIEDFKKTSLFIKENNVIGFIILLGLLLILCINFGTCNARFDSIIEQISYMCILLLFSFRMLLLWRASVFPPAEIASIYEFNHFFRNEVAIVWQFIGLNACIGLIQSIKLIKIYFKNNSIAIADLVQLCILSIVLGMSEIVLFNITGTLNYLMLFLAPLVLIVTSVGIYIIIKLFKWFCNIEIKPWSKIRSYDLSLLSLWNKYLGSSPYYVWRKIKSHDLCLCKKCFYLLIFNRIALPIWYFAIIVGSCYLLKSFGFLKILVPVILYIVTEFIIWRFWPVSEEFSIDGKYQTSDKQFISFSYIDLLSSGLLLSLYNGLCFTVGFFLNDGGYGIMFLSFSLFMSIIKIYDVIRSYKKYDKKSTEINAILLIISLVCVCALFFRYYKNILASLAIINPIISGIIVTIVLFVIWQILKKIFNLQDKRSSKSNIFITLLVIFAISCLGTSLFKKYAIRDHIKQRVLVHVLRPEDGLSRTKDAEEEKRFFEASVNDYILNVYNQQGDEVKSIGEYGNAYFKVRNHSKVGAMFGAQSSDILPARFIIAEHGKLLPFLLILIFLIMLYIGVVTKTRYRACKMLLIQIPALLFIHSLFVWLANTQMFIFLGQDFPLLSLHSKLAVLYFFLLIAIWVSIAISESDAKDNNAVGSYYTHFVGGVFIIFFAIMLMWYYNGANPEDKLNYNEDKKYTLTALLEEIAKDIHDLNMPFAKFQEENDTKVANIHDVSGIISAFNTEYNDYIQTKLGGGDSYKYRVWERFAVKGGAKNNESSSLVHARNKRRVKIGENGKPIMIDLLQLVVRTNYFDKSLPKVNDNSWRGSIVTCEDIAYNTNPITRNDYFTQYCIPGEWIDNQRNIYIVKSKKRETIVSNDSPEYTNFQAKADDYTSSFRRAKYDRLNDVDRLATSHDEVYFARNVVINGNRTFVYPLSHKFFWAYSFANEIAGQKNRLKGRSADFHNDISITIDRDLSALVYDMIKTDDYFTVVAADGNGKIRLMVDKKTNYTINPNDSKAIARVGDELYMTFDAQKDEAYFGNLNLINMKDGPGSSQKPIVWTSVASALNFNWKDLNMYKIIRPFKKINEKVSYNLYLVGGYFAIDQFNGGLLYKAGNKKFMTLFDDENKGLGVSLKDYMTHSSNFYNALMLYIGSYRRDGINMNIASVNDKTSNSIFRKCSSVNKLSQEDYQTMFPILHYGNEDKYFKLNKPMDKDYEKSIIFDRLSCMFDFNTNEKFLPLYREFVMDKNKMIDSYSYMQAPTFGYPIEQNSDNRSFMREAIHQGAVGGPGVWQVSPIFMAQTFGRITMLNRNYQLTMDPDQISTYTLYDGLSDGYLRARKNFLIGMNNVFVDGTAKIIGNGNVSLNDYKLETLDGYYIYGKTGTTNEGPQTLYDGTTKRVHRLGVIITNRNIESIPVSELKNVKFYTVFFTSRKPSMAQYQKILREIIKSASFMKYMNSDNFKDK